MNRNGFLVGLACLTLWVAPAVCAQKTPTVDVAGPTVIAFSPHVTDAEMDKDADLNEALADFQLYAHQAREPLRKLGIHFEELYVKQFRVRDGKKVVLFRPQKVDVGYYFVAPGKKPRIEYGVMTDADMLEIARKYFGIGGPETNAVNSCPASGEAMSLCDVLSNASKYDGKDVTVRGVYYQVIHGSILTDPACAKTKVNMRLAADWKPDKQALSLLNSRSRKNEGTEVVFRGTFRAAHAGSCFGQTCSLYEIEDHELLCTAAPIEEGTTAKQ